jgi:lipopolysaccharide biosynthesis protein
MEEYVEKKYWEKTFDFKLFHGVFPSWDSTARKAYSEGSVFHGLSPEKYRDWLSSCIQLTKSNHHSSERFVFINAWNEWAEGAHLEPDQRYGYAYLQATKEAVEKGCE